MFRKNENQVHSIDFMRRIWYILMLITIYRKHVNEGDDSVLKTLLSQIKEYKKDSLLFNFESLGTKRKLHLLQLR